MDKQTGRQIQADRRNLQIYEASLGMQVTKFKCKK